MSSSEGSEGEEIQLAMQHRGRTRNRVSSGSESVAPTVGSNNPFDCPSQLLKIYAKGPFNAKKPLSQFVTAIDKEKKKNSGGSRVWLCHICNKEFRGSYTRVYSHLLGITGQGVRGCERISLAEKTEVTRLHMEGETTKKGMPLETTHNTQVPTQCVDVESQRGGDYAKGKRKTSTVTGMFNVQSREVADSSIAKFFFANAIPFHVSRSPFFKQMFKDVIVVGSSYVPPGEHKLRTSLLDKEYSKVSVVMEEMRQTWIRVGCSIIMDGWTDIKHRPLINIIVTCPVGPYFLRAIDCTGKRKDATFQFQILKDAIEEIGPSNVVQVVTDSARVCKLAGMMVEGAYKHIFWTPCCVHALNNALKDIGKIDWVKAVVAEARHIQMFICNHHTSLALFRSFSRKEFLKPVDTRYASYFILLERMLEVQEALQLMMVNQEWGRWPEANTSEGKGVKQKILDDDWWTTVRYVCSFISPVVGVIRYVDTDSPSLGEIYETFDSMLGQMKQAIHSRDPTLGFYEEHIRPIVTRRWNTMNTPLHMAAYALNPKWYAARPGRVPPSDDEEVKEGLMKAFRKMYTDEESTLLRTQWLSFVNLRGPTFSKPEARTDRATLAQVDPIGWWTWHGKDAPDLRILATRLLSQVASSSAAERNWSTYGLIHTVKRNHLTSRRAEKLVAVHSALRLQDRQTPEYRQTPATRWDVDPEDASQIDEEAQVGLVGVPLDEAAPHSSSDSDSESDFDATLA
ncbi:hypothetical protein KI387_041340, partial [Taxus chinensis]